MNQLMITGLAWAAVAAFFVSRLDAFARLWLTSKTQATSPVSAADVPEDLIALAMSESEKWAQDAALSTIRERYEQLKDWNRVRAAVGVGELS